ncbi:MAG: hypothetical protein A4E38_00821 [Methanoregulaceae archaeon PtaB.Bin108]|nr:MAG: hypothetical protein A4E38_00821 [Methanoregulaceae archaeon PtaB.Bin108]
MNAPSAAPCIRIAYPETALKLIPYKKPKNTLPANQAPP